MTAFVATQQCGDGLHPTEPGAREFKTSPTLASARARSAVPTSEIFPARVTTDLARLGVMRYIFSLMPL